MTAKAILTSHSAHLTHPKYRADIDGLRAIAILSVVGFHAFPSWVKGGFIGVDIFFVISGYLISTIMIGSLERNSFSFVDFYIRRIKRIFPALLLVLMASFVLGWFVLMADEYKQLGKHIAGGAGFISNFLFWYENGYFDNAAETKPLLHLWSLGIEEQFYIFWPLLLWFAWKKRFNLLTITLAVAVISFALNIGKIENDDAIAAFYSPQTRFWELMVGSVLAYMTLHKQNLFPEFTHRLDAWLGKIIYAQMPDANGKTLRNVQSVLGTALLAIGFLVVTKESHFPGWWALLPTMGAALIIAAGAQAWLNRVILSNRVLVWFGLISFPLYLWHWPLLSFTRLMESETTSYEIFAAVLVSIVLAWLTYRLIEKPIRFGNHSKAKTNTLIVLMIVVGYIGYNCYDRDGLEFRFPKTLQAIVRFKIVDPKNMWRAGTCHLLPKQDYTSFDLCKSESDDDKKTMLLWGDSHAAHLYPGYKISFGDKFNILQRTASSCPPILNLEMDGNPYCKKINDAVFELIKAEKPNKIVLAAVWGSYDWKKIEKTIAQLRKIGITDIDLIGPVPRWHDTLSKQLYLYYKTDPLHRIPERMKFGLDPGFFELDSVLSDFAHRLKVNYISPSKILCNDDGCITRTGETRDTLTAFDAAHLSENGSRLLVSHFPK